MNNENNNIMTLEQILDKKYGTKGQPKREEWEQQFESFRLGVLLEEARTKLGMTQEQRVYFSFSFFKNKV
jgi:HTH-type transcriptional regulator / antitoxin HipB